MKRKSAQESVQYGKSYRYCSNEQAIKDLKRLEKKQHEQTVKKSGRPSGRPK